MDELKRSLLEGQVKYLKEIIEEGRSKEEITGVILTIEQNILSGCRPTDKRGEGMKELWTGDVNNVRVFMLDEAGEGGAYHEYEVKGKGIKAGDVYGKITFQNGPVNEKGSNGLQNEDLLKIVIHRLTCFQKSEFRCRENAIAVTKLEEALMWLDNRTSTRKRKGVEGTSVNHE